MVIRQKYRKTSDRTLTSYDYADTITGKIYQVLYAGTGENSNVLLGFKFDSSDIITEVDGDGAMGKKADVDFDIEFNNSQEIEGTAVINITHGIHAQASPATTTYLIVKLVHVSTTPTETVLGTETTPTLTSIATADTERYAIDLDIARKLFKKGEKLRLTVELWSGGTSAATYPFFCHDPNGRAVITEDVDGGNILDSHDTSLNLWIPFKPIL